MNCATETLQTLSSAASGMLLTGLVLSASLRQCEGFERCQIETSGSSAQLDVLPVRSTSAWFFSEGTVRLEG